MSLRIMSPNGLVGFKSLPDQLVSKTIQAGFTFNIMCIGETGLGKSTLMDSLFSTNFEDKVDEPKEDGIKIKANTYLLEESGVNLRLTICNTIGYGDQLHKDDSFMPIVDYIDAQFEAYLQEEIKIQRSSNFHDPRIQGCLYFITPNGQGLKSVDLICMKKIDSKVNIIPIIAKADTINKSELLKFKENVMSDLKSYGVKIYKFPSNDEAVGDLNSSMNDILPFAVVGSTEFVQVGNKLIRARRYPWGVVEVENDNHCDFNKLREMLVRTNMEDLRETTHKYHYEVYRRIQLQKMGFVDNDIHNESKSFSDQLIIRREETLDELKRKELEMREKFFFKVKEKEEELKVEEKELFDRFDRKKQSLVKDRNWLDEQRHLLEKEISDFRRLKFKYESEKLSSGHHNWLTLGKLRKR